MSDPRQLSTDQLRADIRRLQSWARRNPICSSDPSNTQTQTLQRLTAERAGRKMIARQPSDAPSVIDARLA